MSTCQLRLQSSDTYDRQISIYTIQQINSEDIDTVM